MQLKSVCILITGRLPPSKKPEAARETKLTAADVQVFYSFDCFVAPLCLVGQRLTVSAKL